MNGSFGNETIAPPHLILWRLNEEAVKTNIPVIILIGIFILVGLTGNGFVVYVYGFRFKRTSANMFILWLGICDIVNCSVSLPFEVWDLRFAVLYGNAIACKVFRFTEYLATFSSILTLVCIAFDRYYKICKPFKSFSNRKARRLIVATCFIAVSASCPSLAIYGTKTYFTSVSGVTGSNCAVDDAMKGTIYDVIYFTFIFVTFGILITMLVVLYALMLVAICRWANKQIGEVPTITKTSEKQQLGPRNSNDSCKTLILSTSILSDGKVQDLSGVENAASNSSTNAKTIESTTTITRNSHKSKESVTTITPKSHKSKESTSTITPNSHKSKESVTTITRNSHKSKESATTITWNSHKSKARLGRTTAIFGSVTIAFIFSYLPYLVAELSIFTGLWNDTLDEPSTPVNQMFEVFHKSPYFSCIINPIIFSVLNPEFRKEVTRVFRPQKS